MRRWFLQGGLVTSDLPGSITCGKRANRGSVNKVEAARGGASLMVIRPRYL